jgi:hypothetical protein
MSYSFDLLIVPLNAQPVQAGVEEIDAVELSAN